jgi:outer membrane protein assembly factor BamB
MRTLAALPCCVLVVSFFVVGVSAQSQPPLAPAPNVLTYHNNPQRTALNSLETTLTPFNVNVANFGKIGFLPTDGRVRIEPLFVANVLIQGQRHSVLYVTTEHDSIYAFDADDGTVLWQTSALLGGEVPAYFGSCDILYPESGISATPVIDRIQLPNGAIYFVAASQSGVNGSYHHRLHALDLTTGAELFGGPVEIQGKYPGTGDNSQNGFVIFDPSQYFDRAALLESKGSIYFGFASLCDQRPYTGWVMQYSASTLTQLSVINLTPNGNSGSIWQAGAGIAADSDGYLYVLDANGTFDTMLDSNGFPLFGDYGNAFVKISGAAPMSVSDYFAMYNTVEESADDVDLGSGGAMVIDVPSGRGLQQKHLVVGAGKDGHIYVADRNNMGKWNALNNNGLYQDVVAGLPNGLFGSPAFFNNTVYYGALYASLEAFPVQMGYLQDPSSHTSTVFGYPGGTPSISSSGPDNGIVWAIDNHELGPAPSVLHAYDALDLSKELYNSDQNRSRDTLGKGNRFITPMIANGKVYVSTWEGVAVFGLLGQGSRFAGH